jgi:hypothetical protein
VNYLITLTLFRYKNNLIIKDYVGISVLLSWVMSSHRYQVQLTTEVTASITASSEIWRKQIKLSICFLQINVGSVACCESSSKSDSNSPAIWLFSHFLSSCSHRFLGPSVHGALENNQYMRISWSCFVHCSTTLCKLFLHGKLKFATSCTRRALHIIC